LHIYYIHIYIYTYIHIYIYTYIHIYIYTYIHIYSASSSKDSEFTKKNRNQQQLDSGRSSASAARSSNSRYSKNKYSDEEEEEEEDENKRIGASRRAEQRRADSYGNGGGGNGARKGRGRRDDEEDEYEYDRDRDRRGKDRKDDGRDGRDGRDRESDRDGPRSRDEGDRRGRYQDDEDDYQDGRYQDRGGGGKWAGATGGRDVQQVRGQAVPMGRSMDSMRSSDTPDREGAGVVAVAMPVMSSFSSSSAPMHSNGKSLESSTTLTSPNLSDMRRFLMSPVPKNCGVLQCYIRRNKSGTHKLFPVYSLFLKEGDVFLMASKKRPKNKTSNYLISMGETHTHTHTHARATHKHATRAI
jgi:hypothetical protein